MNGFRLGHDDYDSSEKERAKWHLFAQKNGKEALWKELATLDPKAAQKIPWQNEQRVVRALEVYTKTGQLFSAQNDERVSTYDPLVIGLTTDRTLLYERINQRVDLMVKQGLVEEAKELYQKGGELLPAGKGIGYKEFYPYFEGDLTLDEAIAQVKQNSRRYAKR